MKTFLVVSSLVALAAAAPASAGGRGGMGGGMNGGGWHPAPMPSMPTMPSHPTMPAGGWHPMPSPQPGGWHPQPQPHPMPGGWHPQPNQPSGWHPQPNQPGGWHPQPNQPGGWHPQPNRPGPIGGNGCLGGCHPQGPKWGGRISGRWWAGMRAPGGWGAYHQPRRGYSLPSYWIAPSFYIADFGNYGLPAPPQGYYWSRYYDDAVLTDPRGQVWDSVGGVRWDQGDRYGDNAYDGSWSGYGDYSGAGYDGYPGYSAGDYDQGGYDQGYQDEGYRQHGSSGVGGAIVGGVVGGITGNAIAGRGDKLGGTLIGAGVGAIAGQAIDKASNRRRYEGDDRRGYYAAGPGAGYGYPGASAEAYRQSGGSSAYARAEGTRAGYGGTYSGGGYAGGGYAQTTVYPGGVQGPGASTTMLADGTVVTTSSRAGSAGYYADGYYYPGQTLTTVTVERGRSSRSEVVEEEVIDEGRTIDRSPQPRNWSYTKQRYRYTK